MDGRTANSEDEIFEFGGPKLAPIARHRERGLQNVLLRLFGTLVRGGVRPLQLSGN